MRRKPIRVLALLMAFVMLLSASCISVFGYMTDYKTPLTDENGRYYFTPNQAGTWLMDTVDELLDTINNGEAIFDKTYVGKDIFIDIHSYEVLCSSISGTWDEIDGLVNAVAWTGAVGDLDDIKVDALDAYVRRNDPSAPDMGCLATVVLFLQQNQKLLRKIISNNFDWGLLKDKIMDLGKEEDGLNVGLLEDIGKWLSNFLYMTLEESAGKTEGEKGSGTTDTTFDPAGVDADLALQDMLNYIINDTLGIALTSDKIDADETPFYDFVYNVIQEALNTLVVPMLKEVILDACDIEVSEKYPEGSPDENNNTTLVMVLGIVGDLLGKDIVPDFSGYAYPGEKVEKLLTWFFLEGGMGKFIVIDSNGLALQDGFVELLNKLIRLAIPLLYNSGFDYLPKDLIYSTDDLNIPEGEEGYITNSQCYTQVVSLLLSSFVDGYYCNPNAGSIAEVVAYALASLCANKLPEYNYLDMLDANYTTDKTCNGYKNLPMKGTYSFTSQKLTSSGWTDVSRTYTIPYAALDIGVSIGVFYLDGLITADFTQVPDSVAKPNATNTASATVRFEKFLKVIVDWAVKKYAPLFDTTFSLNAKYTQPEQVWKEIDEVLFSLIPSNWMPQTVTDHTMDSTVNTCLGMNGNAAVPMDGMGDILFGWLLGSLLDFDLQQLFSLLQRNTTSEANLAKPTVTVIMQLVDRVLYAVFNKTALLPETGTSRNAFTTPTTVTNLNGLLTKDNVGYLLQYLIKGLSENSAGELDWTLLSTLIGTAGPLLMGSEYIKPFRTSMLDQGEITAGQLANYADTLGTENEISFDYVPATVNAFTTGTYYTVEISKESGVYNAVVTPVSLPADYAEGTDYYTQKFKLSENVTRFSETDANHKYYVQNNSYVPVTLSGNGTDFDSAARYFSTEFVTATVDATTNGTYFTSASASAAVTLPEAYTEGQTYYTHPEVILAAESSGSYLKLATTYSEVLLNGTAGTNFVENKNYYTAKQTIISNSYLDAFNADIGKIAMGKFVAGDASTNGIGSYISSISGKNYYVFREAEDFPTALYAYNNFNDFQRDAQKFFKKYVAFVTEEIPEATEKWEKYFSGESKKAPDEIYPFYKASGAYTGKRVNDLLLTINFNDTQVIKDVINLYGSSAFITSDTPNTQSLSVSPAQSISHAYEAGNSDALISQYKGYKEFCEKVKEYSDNLNNYYDGVNYYINNMETNRKSYTQTSTTQVDWAMRLAASAYNDGNNKDAQGNKVYTEKSYNALKSAYEAANDLCAQAILGDSTYRTTQSMASKVRDGLIDAYYGLVKYGEAADLTQLLQYLVMARRIKAAEIDLQGTDKATYTAASFNAMLAVLNTAAALYDSAPGIEDQEAVDLITTQLYASVNALVYNKTPGIINKPEEEITGGDDPSGETPVLAPEDKDITIGTSWGESGITYGYIYGVPEVKGYTYQGTKDTVFKIQGLPADGVTYSASAYGPGTGSYISGKDNGTAVFRYTVILFGDINGDARIDGTDKTSIIASSVGAASYEMSAAQSKAADVNGDGIVDVTDAMDIQDVIDYKATIDQKADVTGSRVVK